MSIASIPMIPHATGLLNHIVIFSNNMVNVANTPSRISASMIKKYSSVTGTEKPNEVSCVSGAKIFFPLSILMYDIKSGMFHSR